MFAGKFQILNKSAACSSSKYNNNNKNHKQIWYEGDETTMKWNEMHDTDDDDDDEHKI